MEIVEHNGNPHRLPTLRQHIHMGGGAFRYDGYSYALVNKQGASFHTQFHVTAHHYAAFNLKSQTVRGIHEDELVEPIRVEVHTFPTRPYKR